MINVDSISVAFGDTPVLEDVSLSVALGEWVGIIGPNGAGKSTLIKAIVGLLEHQGTITIGGREVDGLSARQRAQIVAYVPQVPSLPVGMSVGEYVLLGRAPYISLFKWESKADHEAVDEALELLDVAMLGTRDVATLSGGEAQRVVLARAIAQEPQVLLLDEPTSALDLGRQQEAMHTIDKLRTQRNLTVVAAMHDLMLAGQFGDRLLLLNRHRILAEGPPSQVLTSENISVHYGAKVRILEDLEGGVLVVPVRKIRDQMS